MTLHDRKPGRLYPQGVDHRSFFQPPKNSIVHHSTLVTCSSLVIHDPDDDDPDPVTGVSAALCPQVSL